MNFLTTFLIFSMSILINCSAIADTMDGIWRSKNWPQQSHSFNKNGSVTFDEGSKGNSGSTGKYRRNGDKLEWQIKWKTGSYTNWTGTIDSEKSMRIRFYNAWDQGTGNDTLIKE